MGCDQDVVRQLQATLSQAQALAAQLVSAGPPSVVLKTPGQLDAALDQAVGGETLVLDPMLVYPNALRLTKAVTLASSLPVTARVTLTTPMPSFRGGLVCEQRGAIGLVGIEVRHFNPDVDLLVLGTPGMGDGARLVDGCRVLGDPMHGAKRGLAANANGVTVRRCFVEDCFGPLPGNDTQAFLAWDSPGPFLIEDNYLSGGAETFLLGGADPQSAAGVPSHGVVRGNTITKRPEWRTQAIVVKNTVELKNAAHWLFEDNDISYAWGGHGQDGYLLMLTPRNQDGGAPFSGITDVTFRNNRFRHGAGWVAMNGDDNDFPSQPLDGCVLDANDVADLDPALWTGQPPIWGTTNKAIAISRGPRNVTITGNKVAGQHLDSAVYLSDPPKCVQLVLTNNTLPPSTYGLMGGGCAPGDVNDPTKAWATYVESGTLSGNLVA